MLQPLLQLIEDRIALEYQVAGQAVNREDLILVVGTQVHNRLLHDNSPNRDRLKREGFDTLAGVELRLAPEVNPDPYAVVLAKRSALYG